MEQAEVLNFQVSHDLGDGQVGPEEVGLYRLWGYDMGMGTDFVLEFCSMVPASPRAVLGGP